MKRSIHAVATAAVAALAVVGATLRAQTPSTTADPFFDDSQVHSIYLAINSRDWQTLRDNFLDNSYYPSDFKWNNTTIRNVGIRSRGNGSRSGDKPGLRVDFDRYTTSQTFLGLKSFILRNQTQDPSNMHEWLSMLLFRRLGVKAPREAFARLYINNGYAGLYTIVESVDKSFLRQSFDDGEGHLYEYDYNATDQPYYLEDRGTNPASYVPHPFKPETREIDPEPEKIVDLVRIVNNDSDAVFRTNIAQYINWDNFLRHIATENALSDQDGFNGDYGVNNFYFYRLHNQRTFMWIPWDKSESFKNPPTQAIFRNFLDGEPSRRNRLSARAMTFPDLQTRYLDYLLEAANALGERDAANPADTRGWMEREVDRTYAQIREAVMQDSLKPYSNEQFEAAVQALRTFARERPPFVRNAVDECRRQRP